MAINITQPAKIIRRTYETKAINIKLDGTIVHFYNQINDDGEEKKVIEFGEELNDASAISLLNFLQAKNAEREDQELVDLIGQGVPVEKVSEQIIP